MPECKGCGKKIKRDQSRFVHKFYERANHNFPTVHTFCNDNRCILTINEGMGMAVGDVRKLCEKKWGNNKSIKETVEKLKWRLEIMDKTKKMKK